MIQLEQDRSCPSRAHCKEFLYVWYFVGTSGSYGLVWTFREKMQESNCILFNEVQWSLGNIENFQTFGRHLAVHLQTTYLVRLHQAYFREALKSCR